MTVRTIIVADDEERLRRLVKHALHDERYRILEARNGAEALELAQREEPDLMILDWMMPVLTGIEVLETLRDDPGTTPVPAVMLSARAERADRACAMSLGACQYLVKPFSPLELVELVGKILLEEA